MISKNIFLIFLIFSIGFVSSATLSISPPQIDFIGNTNQQICRNISIKTNGTNKLLGETRWAKEDYFERKLSKHNLSSEDLNLEVYFEKKLMVENKKETEICLKAKKEGNFHGLLLYRIEGKPVQIGIWINSSFEGNSLMKITGNFVKTEEKSNFFLTLPVILLAVFLILIIWYKKRIS